MPGLSFDLVLTTLVKLGAKLPMLTSLGWDAEPHIRSESVTEAQRNEILYRLVGLVTASARYAHFTSQQSLLLMTIQSWTPPE